MKKRIVKFIAIFLVITILMEVFSPLASYAIGSGPSAPEYNSFMPAGSGLHVSPHTGDMSYNIPLLSLPSPEGDYPINLFYQAGIKPEEDASWVGLGWNLNVGSITRNVVGIPDDYYNADYQVVDESKGHANLPAVLDGATKARVITQRNFNSPYFVNFDVGYPSTYAITSATTTRIFNQYGILHGRAAGLAAVTGQSGNPNVMFDSYPLYDQTEDLMADKNNPELFNGGTLPAYDQYTVSAQGLYGLMEPLILDNGSLFRQGKVEQYGSPTYENPNVTMSYSKLKLFSSGRPKQQFRFKGEFSNSLLATPNNYQPINSNTDGTVDFGSNGLGYTYTVPSDPNSFNTTSLRLPGANHVEYYLNEEIISGTAKTNGFINYQGHTNTQRTNFTFTNPANQTLSYPVDKQIGGFSVTTPDGTTYHYALPVYTHDHVKKHSYDMEVGTSRNINRQTNSMAPYAYTWLLTAVTGADYFDANNNGYTDYGDWGNWKNFVYGKPVSRSYAFRDPLTGDKVDVNGVKSTEQGFKELYYLEAAYSRTHTMLFVKDTRTDATNAYLGGANIIINPLKLTAMILLKNEAVSKINTALGGTNTDFFGCFGNINKANNANTSSPYSNTSIIDDKDIQAITALSSAAYKASVITEVRLNYDYSLCPVIENQPLADLNSTGKLTLKSVKSIGRNGASMLAPVEFNYELENPEVGNIYLTHIPGQLNEGACYGRINIGNAGSNFKEGDIIKMVFSDSKTYFATLIKGYAYNNPVVNLYDVIFLGNNIPGTDKIWTSIPAYATTTKNPPYTKDFFDDWQYFKSDYTGFGTVVKSESKATTVNSSKSTDSWSLRRILSSSGSVDKIEYESDSYANVVFNRTGSIKLLPAFQYTKNADGLLSTELSYCDFRTVNKNGTYVFTAQEDIVNRLQVGMQVQISTVGTFGRLRESVNDLVLSSEEKKTYFGTDAFEVTNIISPRSFIGHFVAGTSSATNPFWITPGGTYPDKKMFYHNASFLSFDRNKSRVIELGGGIRVSKITTKENPTTGKEIVKYYDYNDAISGRTSGQVIVDPDRTIGSNNFNETDPDEYNEATPVYRYGETDNAKTMFANYDVKFNNLNKNAQNAAYLLWNGVTYEYNAIRKEVDGNLYTSYQQMRFRKMTESMLSYTKTNDFATTNGSHYCTINIVDNTAQVGQLLYNRTISTADNTVLNEEKYSYNSSINDITNFQGVLEQVFNEKRTGTSYSVGVITKLSRYPSVLMSIVSNDYLKGISDTKVNRSYDLYNGTVTKLENRDSYGNQFITENYPAYNVYSEMGLRSAGLNNKNMLNASAGVVKYKYNSGLNPVAKYLEASSTIWAKDNTVIRNQYSSTLPLLDDQVVNNNIWRPSSVFDFNVNNLSTDGSALTGPSFDWNNPSMNTTNWIQAMKFAKYDPYSRAYMNTNANDISSGKRYGYNGSLLIAECNLSNNFEYTFSGVEDPNTNAVQPTMTMPGSNETGYFGGDVYGTAIQNTTYAHTGKYSARIEKGTTGLVYRAYIKPTQFVAGRTYKTSVWVYNNSEVNKASLKYLIYAINSNGTSTATSYTGYVVPGASTITCGNWKLLEMVFTIPVISGDYYIELSCSNTSTSNQIWVDDFRVQPIESSMNCYVYDEVTNKLNYILDKDNFYTRYEYDNIGRVIATYKETVSGEKKLSDSYYNYSRKP